MMRSIKWLPVIAATLMIATAWTVAAAAWPLGFGAVEKTGPALYSARCGGCHALDHNKYGPSHRGVYGRLAGTQPGYRYSAALAHSRIVWTETTLNQWLIDPDSLAPGTRMTAKFSDPGERRLIIAYLRDDPRAR